MRVRIHDTGPDGRPVDCTGDTFAGRTFLEVVEGMMLNPFTQDADPVAYMRRILAGIGMGEGPLPDEPDEAAEAFLSRLVAAGYAAFSPEGGTQLTPHQPQGDTMTDNIIAIYHPTNQAWPDNLRIRLVCVSSDQSKPSRYMWTANGAGNCTKDATINAANLAPKRSYSMRHAAIAAARRAGWIVEIPETPESIAAAAMGRKGGKSKSPAKSAAARKNAAKARKAIDPEKRAKAVAESNRRRAKK